MDPIFDDFMRLGGLPVSVLTARLALAVALGGLLGLEREWRRHPAGLRTHILVCLASATVAIIAIELSTAPSFAGDATRIDPLRLIEAVTGGVAFLAAGLIVFARGEVRGLTTGAGLWLAGAIGLACGLGYWPVALLATLFGIAILWLLRVLEDRLKLNLDDRVQPRDGDPGSDDNED